MTQVKEMTNSEINLKLALLCGHELITEREDVVNRRQRNDYEGGGVVVLYGDHYIVRANGKYGIWDPCTDPAASLEVQAKALEKNPVLYLKLLSASVYGTTYAKVQEYDLIPLIETKRLLTATPRERAEAAYITLSQVLKSQGADQLDL